MRDDKVGGGIEGFFSGLMVWRGIVEVSQRGIAHLERVVRRKIGQPLRLPMLGGPC